MMTAVTVSASRNADSTAAVNEKISDRSTLERTLSRIFVNENNNISRRK